MRSFVGWLNHRDAVFSNLNTLLLLYPPKRQFGDDFPGLRLLVRRHFDAGVSAASSALQIAERIIGNFGGQLGGDEKAIALDALIATGRRGFSEIAESHVRGERDAPSGDRAAFVARLAGVAIFMAGRMAEEGTLGRNDCEVFAERLAASLGADSERAKLVKNSFLQSVG